MTKSFICSTSLISNSLLKVFSKRLNLGQNLTSEWKLLILSWSVLHGIWYLSEATLIHNFSSVTMLIAFFKCSSLHIPLLDCFTCFFGIAKQQNEIYQTISDCNFIITLYITFSYIIYRRNTYIHKLIRFS